MEEQIKKPEIKCPECGEINSFSWDKREIFVDSEEGRYFDLSFEYCSKCGHVKNVDLD